MKIQINAVHFVADESLKSFLQKKIDKLETFYDRILGAEVFLKLDKGDKQNTHTKFVEVKVKVSGGQVFVEEKGKTFEEAIDMAMDTLTRKIKQYKERNKDVSRGKTEMSENYPAEDIEDEL